MGRGMTTVLTGIKPTGYPHVGNYVGAIRPALRRAGRASGSYFFVADYHALNQIQDAALLRELSRAVAATWLACGLDTERSCFYRQSDVPEIPELTVILNAVTPKGWMNRAHAYKAAVAANAERGLDPDDDVNMGLYGYPVLMAADILACRADVVPVGRDQVQHVEIARDIAERLNRQTGREVLALPRHEIPADAAAIPGVDGRKMSKSYDNTIPLFADARAWTRAVAGIRTDSSPRDAPKTPEGTAVYEIFAGLATAGEAAGLHADLSAGRAGWGDAKARLVSVLERELTGPGERFAELMASPATVDEVLAAGAERVRPVARAVLDGVREAVGLARASAPRAAV
jgi:tryptophanyl-tRNA synthetase